MPGVDKIGYTDSYGGLISATEARALSERGKENLASSRLNSLLELVKRAASGGKTSAKLDLTPVEAEMFRGLGYEVKQEMLPLWSLVDWEKEKVTSQNSPSSETTYICDSPNFSSSGEDVTPAEAVVPHVVAEATPNVTEQPPEETL